jgi:hypothetical protein
MSYSLGLPASSTFLSKQISNQLVVLYQNKSALSHQQNEQASSLTVSSKINLAILKGHVTV